MNAKRPPRLLIVSRDLALLRGHYEDVIVRLARQGVKISVRYLAEGGLDAESYTASLLQHGCFVRVEPLPRVERNSGDRLALALRQLANLLRYYHPDYQNRDWLRDTRFAGAPAGPRRWASRLGRLGSTASLTAMRLAGRLDRVLPPSESARALIAAEQPDAVVAVPIIRAPEFVDYLKAAAERRLPTSSWIQSWDNLSSKGLVHFTLDRIFVWNEIQREELARYHGVPGERVCITGAQTFDHWYDGPAPSSRNEFCAEVGLEPDRPIILYLVSSRQIETSPATFFARWLEAIRSSGVEALEAASVLVRPHPLELSPWAGLEELYPLVAVSPSTAEAPINSAEFRRRFRDELYHAAVVVGLNTSGMIDAAIFGKPVCTVELPELAFGQRGTVHFEYLTRNGSLLRTSSSLDAHTELLVELIERAPYEPDERSLEFARNFVRPLGADVTPASVFAAEMLRLLETPTQSAVPGRLASALGLLVHRSAPLLGVPLERQPFRRRWNASIKRLRKGNKQLSRGWNRRRKSLRKGRKSLRVTAAVRLGRLRRNVPSAGARDG